MTSNRRGRTLIGGALALAVAVPVVSAPTGGVVADLADPFEVPTLIRDLNTDGADTDPILVGTIGDSVFFLTGGELENQEEILEFDIGDGTLRTVDFSEDDAPSALPVVFDAQVVIPLEDREGSADDRLVTLAPGGAITETGVMFADDIRDLAAGEEAVYLKVGARPTSIVRVELGEFPASEVLASGADGADDLFPMRRPDGTEILALEVDGSQGREAARIDPGVTPPTTVFDVNSGAGDGRPNDFAAVAGVLYFTARDGTDTLYPVAGAGPPFILITEATDVDWALADDTAIYIGVGTGGGDEVRRKTPTQMSFATVLAQDGRIDPITALSDGIVVTVSDDDVVRRGDVANRQADQPAAWFHVVDNASTAQIAGPAGVDTSEISEVDGLGAADAAGKAALLMAENGLWRFEPGSAATQIVAGGAWDGLPDPGQVESGRTIAALDDGGWAFVDDSSTVGNELFVTAGSSAGTSLVPDQTPGTANSGAEVVAVFGTRALVRAE
ncbi:MAG: hypothetical protein AAGG08_11805, partial [Actinomycetota bacterium]